MYPVVGRIAETAPQHVPGRKVPVLATAAPVAVATICVLLQRLVGAFGLHSYTPRFGTRAQLWDCRFH